MFQTQKRVHIDPGHNLAAPHLSLATPTNSFLNSKNAKVHLDTVVDNEENPPSLFEKNVWRNIVLSFFGSYLEVIVKENVFKKLLKSKQTKNT